jgi:Caspase domain/Domain of unknown function (DUF4384)
MTLARLAVAALALSLAAVAGAQTPAEPGRSTRHALIIGIGDYAAADITPLPGVALDISSARRMAAAMEVPASQVTVLRDREASAEGIRRAVAALGARVQDGDRVFVYYSGHGTRWQDPLLKAEGCVEGLLASDGQVISNVEFGLRLAPLARRADKMLVFYDACFAGGLAEAPLRTRSLLRQGDNVLTPKFSRAGAPEACGQAGNFRTRSLPAVMQQAQALPQNVVQVGASAADEASFDSSTSGGLATAAWRDCLLGQAQDADGSGAITALEVTRCAQARIDQALAGLPSVSGQKMTLVGNSRYVPVWAPAAKAAAAGGQRATPPEILAELHSQRDGSRRVAVALRKTELKIGRDVLAFDVTPARDGHLYVALAGSDGKSLYLLYPNDLARDNRVRAGQQLSLPGAGWEIVAGGPAGPEQLLVMVSDAPRDLSDLATERAGPFMKTLLDDQGRSRLQALLAGGTPRAGCGKAGAASCSDAFGAALLTVRSVD